MRLAFLSIFAFISLTAQQCSKAKTETQQNPQEEVTAPTANSSAKEAWVAFYNVENLYDTQNDPEKEDEDFTPEGKYQWTDDKYQIKQANLAKVLSQLGGGTELPDVIGLVEIENRQVLQDLCNQTALKAKNYKIVQEDSKDARGVDVALLYNPSLFQYISHKAYTPTFSEPKKTRDFLVVEGKMAGETVYFVVNHWPSRRSGSEESEKFRVEVAQQVRKVCDDIRKKDKNANIILMGDFNDDPTNKSIAEIISAKSDAGEATKAASFYNPLSKIHNPENEGSLEYDGKWNLFDQFLISSGLLDEKGKWKYVEGSATIFHPDWLRVGFGKAKMSPRRSIFHDKFRDDGFSDHFPVYMKLERK